MFKSFKFFNDSQLVITKIPRFTMSHPKRFLHMDSIINWLINDKKIREISKSVSVTLVQIGNISRNFIIPLQIY
jgi:hypothetical protein